MINLGTQQKEALEAIKKFINSKETFFVLQGFAGTGKSFLIKQVIQFLEDSWLPYALCAPTHKAKVVLERFTDREAMTIHKLLALSPLLEIMHLDFNDLKFIPNKNLNQFPRNGLVICDEGSMVNNDLCDYLIERAESNKCKLLIVGDRAQLKPVKGDSISKVFGWTNQYTLTEIFRQKGESGLTEPLLILRDKSIKTLESSMGKDGSLICFDNIQTFLKESLPYFKKAIKNSDIIETKLLAYTNNRVDAYNAKIKSALFGEEEYYKSEFLTGCENLEFNGTKFWNSMDYIIADNPIKKDSYIPGFINLPGYTLNLYNSANKQLEEVFILSKDISKDYFDSLAERIEVTRLNAVEAKLSRKPTSSKLWKDYYKLVGSFTSPIDLYYSNRLIRKKSFSYGYATTIHKSQGSSINNVFIDWKNINLCREELELRQLQYVSLSRTITNAYIYQ